MFTLIRKAHVFAPEDLGVKDVLICNEKIVKVADSIDFPWDEDDLTVIDAEGKSLVPGFIDQHVHIIGGGGEDGFASLIREIQMTDCVRYGVTTVVGVVLAFIYAPRNWCSFCPMGTISRWVAPKKASASKAFTTVHVSSACQMKCKQCARVCPMQLTPYDARGEAEGYLHPDCIKCGKCTQACPIHIMKIGR